MCQIQGVIRPHAIIILPSSRGTEVLVCYEDEGVFIDTYGRITKETVLQWGEMPASVGKSEPERERERERERQRETERERQRERDRH